MRLDEATQRNRLHRRVGLTGVRHAEGDLCAVTIQVGEDRASVVR